MKCIVFNAFVSVVMAICLFYSSVTNVIVLNLYCGRSGGQE